MASQDSDTPEVHDVVRKLADRNPQKLRQIGMNYDIANAKGVVEISDEEKEKKASKAKEAKEKKIKEKEEADKEKYEFELWKKEKKQREEEAKGKAAETKGEKRDDVKEEGSSVASKGDTKKEDIEASNKEGDQDEPIPVGSKVEATKIKAGSAPSSVDAIAVKPGSESDSNNDDGGDTPSTVEHSSPKASAQPGNGELDNTPVPPPGAGGPVSISGDDAAPQPAGNTPPLPDNKQNPWNAVCVLGLRVYSQDPEVSITLVKPKDADESAVLDADGATQAGATM